MSLNIALIRGKFDLENINIDDLLCDFSTLNIVNYVTHTKSIYVSLMYYHYSQQEWNIPLCLIYLFIVCLTPLSAIFQLYHDD